MLKFNVGDKVKIVGKTFGTSRQVGFSIGEVGEIIQVDEQETNLPYKVKSDKYDWDFSFGFWYPEKSLKKI